ncbi:contractile injection system tape measure protein [Aquimarina algiphila]|uniref:contractile injection system tape measure protein n=1 Tax=Aquimarina algiphila TaxID=2047982 RepID=UPI002330C196|nr:contractile injection system tape measure protein [Aquimarina algiphila]
MITQEEHIVGKLSFDFDVHSIDLDTENWERLSMYSQEHLISVIEDKLSKIEKDDEWVFVDKIEIELNLEVDHNWEKNLKTAFEKAIDIEFNKIDFIPENSQKIPSKTIHLSALYHFLEYGLFPWYYSTEAQKTIEDSCLKTLDETASKKLIHDILKTPKYKHRLFYIFTDDSLYVLLGLTNINREKIPQMTSLFDAFCKTLGYQISIKNFRTGYWEGLFHSAVKTRTRGKNSNLVDDFILFLIKRDFSAYIAKKRSKDAFIKPYFSKRNIRSNPNPEENVLVQIKEILEKSNPKRSKTTPASRSPKTYKKSSKQSAIVDNEEIVSRNNNHQNFIQQFKQEGKKTSIYQDNEDFQNILSTVKFSLDNEKAEGTYVTMAGVVLMHPFLEHFFDSLGLLNKGEWISPNDAKKGVQLLTYLATGKTSYPEYEMMIFKCICGLPFETYVGSEFDITEKQKQESNSLLSSLIAHWSVLKNTSIEGLRTNFFLREGKLTLKDGHWCLLVEQKAEDILLSRLPWTLSVIRLPWLPNIIQVIWT